VLISPANAQDAVPPATSATTAVPGTSPIAPGAPDTTSIVVQNVGMIALLVVMFYFLLIRPQQKRFQAHKAMVDALKKGDRIVTAGGLLGTIDTLVNDDEAIIDLGNGMKVTALRSTLQAKTAVTSVEKK